MSSPDYSNFLNDATALFPIMVLTKVVSFRFRNVKDVKDFEHVLHRGHIVAVGFGEGLALWGAGWESGNSTLAGLVAALLVVAATILGIDLWIAARTHANTQHGSVEPQDDEGCPMSNE